jgi:hypothetical protein
MTTFIIDFYNEDELLDSVVVDAVSPDHAIDLARERTVADDDAEVRVAPLPTMVAA